MEAAAAAAAAADADAAEKPLPFSPPAPREDEGKETAAEDGKDESSELRRLLMPNPRDLPLTPPSAVEFNFVTYFAIDFMKPGHDQYIHRHANGLCVVGLAPSHVALKEDGGVTAVDFNVGKSDRSELKVTGKRKKNAQHFESNSALCKVCTNSNFYIVRCCVKGSLLEVNDRLINQPELLSSSRRVRTAVHVTKPPKFYSKHLLILDYQPISVANSCLVDREGYIAIIMPKPADWIKIKDSFLSAQDYKKLRGLA